jgi:acetyl-CoA synthetase
MNGQVRQIAERIRDLREIFAKDVAYMAKVTGVPPAEYQRLENGEGDFYFTFLQNAAQEFGVDVIELITGQSPTLSGYEVVRRGEGVPLEHRSGFKYMHLASMFKDKISEPFMVTAVYDRKLENSQIVIGAHEGEEFNLVIKGKLKVRLGDTIEVLSEGDSVYYNSSIPHGMVALDSDCLFFSMVMNPHGKVQNLFLPGPAQGGIRRSANEGLIYENFASAYVDESGVFSGIGFNPTDNFNFAYDVVDALAAADPNKRAMLWVSREKTARTFTFGDMSRYSNKTANYFTSLGIKKGDKVMLVLKRHYEYWYAILALHKIGAVAIPATHLLTKKDFLYRFEKSGISAIVCTGDGNTAAECDLAAAEYPALQVKIMTRGEKAGWHDFMSGVEAASAEWVRVATNKEDPMVMFFTSGTSGYPKIVSHNYTYPLGHIPTAKFWQNVKKDGLHFTVSETGWAKSVWGKLYGQWLCECAVFTYDFDKFEAADILALLHEHGITSFCAPPTMYRFFIKEDLAKYDFSRLEQAVVAGEALNPEVHAQFKSATGLTLMEIYGQTEATVLVGNFNGMTPKPGSMGKPSPQYSIDILDTDGKPVRAGEVGEIVVRTDGEHPCGLFAGYYNDPAKTAEVWKNKVYHTGDTAWRDEDGYYWYVGRTDDLIKSAGYRIGPFEIESVIMELPYVLECAVTGVPDEIRGQAVKATIVLVKGMDATDELKKEIQNYVKENTAPYKYPRVVEFIDALPKTISGKIKRISIRDEEK